MYNSEIHTMPHHRCWYLIHTDLSRLTFSVWRFICINNEKSFRTVWTELAQEFPEVFNHCAEQTLWITEDRLWNKRPDGIAFQMPTDTKSGVICLLEFKHMSDVTRHYIARVKIMSVTQYESLRSTLVKVMQHSGWVVHKHRFVVGAWYLNDEEFKKNLEYFKP